MATARVSRQLDRGGGSAARPLDDLVPRLVGGWARASEDGVLIPRGEDAGSRFYDDVVTRYYTSPTAPPVMLLIAYGSAQTGRTQIHRPEVCYPAAGFRIRGVREVRLPIAAAGPLTARAMTERRPAVSSKSSTGVGWPGIPHGQPGAALGSAQANFARSHPDGALVRMSLIHPDRMLGSAVLTDFAAALVRSAGPNWVG